MPATTYGWNATCPSVANGVFTSPPIQPPPPGNGLKPPPALPTTSGTTRYVSPSGNNQNPGTQASPWKTINYGVSHIAAGQTLMIAPGVYTQEVQNIASGTSSNPVVIRGQDPANPPVIRPNSGAVRAINVDDGQQYVWLAHVERLHFIGELLARLRFCMCIDGDLPTLIQAAIPTAVVLVQRRGTVMLCEIDQRFPDSADLRDVHCCQHRPSFRRCRVFEARPSARDHASGTRGI
jgi:hypothetical protein